MEVEKGSTVFIRATALEGSGKKFAYWSTGNTVASGRGVICTNKNPYEFVATEDIAFYVNFVTEDTDLNVTIEAIATEGGTATIYGEGKQTITLGSEVIFEAKANDGYRFTNWTNGTEVVSEEPIYTTVAREATVLTANFEKNISTGIEAATEETREMGIYDISGREIENITRPGIYVVNGKTILRK